MVGAAVIGTGYWGRNHVRVYKELKLEGLIDKLRICDLDEHHVERLSAAFGVEYATDYRDIISDTDMQAISIVTPSKMHYQLAKEFMEAGKDVLVEKPMTMNIEEAKGLVDISTRSRRILMAGHIFRYHAAVQELKLRMGSGELGKLQIILGNRLAFGVPRQDMGVIYAVGIHELDTFCYLLGVDYPIAITAVTSKSFGQDIEETAMITMDFGDTKGYALESWLVPAYGKRRDLVVVGSERSARIDYLNPQELHIFDTRIVTENGIPTRVENEGEHTIPIPYAEPLKEELKHFISCVDSRQKPLSDGIVGLRAVQMAEAALASARTNKIVKLENYR